MSVVIVAVAGSIGALTRYAVAGAAQRVTGSSLPVGTALVNLLGALALGVIVGAGEPHPTTWTTLAAGFTGGFTTFSTWMVETSRLGLAPRPSLAALGSLTVMTAGGVALAALGYHLAH